MSQALQRKNARMLFWWLWLVMAGSCIIFYYLMHMQAHHMQQKQLQLTQFHYINAFKANPSMQLAVPGEYSIVENNAIPAGGFSFMDDTAFFDVSKREVLSYTKLTGSFFANGKMYMLTTYVSDTEISHLIIKVFLCEVCILALLFIVIIYINDRASRSLWTPFRTTMQQLGSYNITGNAGLILEENTGVTEFDQLNTELTALVERSRHVYLNQKQFVENASHEIQTPLTIIRSKLEMLINQGEITENTALLLADITDANDRLSQMNKNLLMLAKIENNQFPDEQQVDMNLLLHKIIENYMLQYQEHFPQIDITATSVTIQANASLMEMLAGNLIKNSIVHNIAGGWVKINLSQHCLAISNSGPNISVNPELLFNRFSKGNDAARSTGLGLALVKQICQLYGFKPSYTYYAGVHTLSIVF
ncbi:MAG TPA: HAMP domain-containing sensor histidine kinase [Chitinophagaceae bacterium]|nr:HAMP domain-containing sensor histidine kinase [Chitinophagaceae bacterium]